MSKLVIFDLDGTLLNTIADLGNACNHALKTKGHPVHTPEEYKLLVGGGITKLIEKALPEDFRNQEYILQVREIFLNYYCSHIDVYTQPYDGISSLLHKLNERGILIGVASNKFDDGTQALVRHFFSDIEFVQVCGNSDRYPLKPNPDLLHAFTSLIKVPPSKIIMVGDSGVDMAFAKACGIESVGVTWGFRSRQELEEAGATHIVESVEELEKLLQ